MDSQVLKLFPQASKTLLNPKRVRMAEVKRFLVAGGDEESQTEIRGILSNMRISSVSMAVDGEEALSYLEPKDIQFIIVFWTGGTMPGPVFVQKVKERGAFRDVPILILSQKLSKDEARLTAELEIHNVLPWPVEAEHIQEKLEKMRKKEEEMPESLRKLRQASGFIAEGKLDEAMNLVKVASVDKSQEKLTQTMLGEINLLMKNYRDAEDVLKNVVAQNDSFIPAKQLLARAFSKNGNSQEAINMLKQLAAYSPLSMPTLLGLGSAYYAAGNLDESEESYQKVVKMDPTNQQANTGLGAISFEKGNLDAAKEYLGNVEDTTEMMRTLNNVGVGLVNAGKFDEGIQSYNAAIEVLNGNDNYQIILYNLGLGYKKSGKFQEAAKSFAEALRMDPTYSKAYDAFAKLVKESKAQGVKIDKALIDYVKASKKSSVA